MAKQKVAVFDDNGETIEEVMEEVAEDGAPAPAADEPEAEEVDPDSDVEQEEPAEEPAEEAPLAPAKSGRTWKIGNKSFATQAEALAYAESHVNALETEQQLADAYRQGIQDGALRPKPTENVTPPPAEPDLNAEELYTNPTEFLKKYENRIVTKTRAQLDQEAAVNEQSNQLWREFTDRHPGFTDFRREVESFVGTNAPQVQAIVGTKGRPAGYDWIAMKLKNQFEQYATALRPKRALSNAVSGPTPTTKQSGVTPKTPEKKPLSFADELRSIRKRHIQT